MTTHVTEAARFYTRLVTLELDIEHGRVRTTLERLERVRTLRYRAFRRYWRRRTELASRAGRELQTSEKN